MSMIYVLIPLALVLLVFAVWALYWAIRTGQFDDLDSQGWSVVLDDDSKPPAAHEPGIREQEKSPDRTSSDTGKDQHD